MSTHRTLIVSLQTTTIPEDNPVGTSNSEKTLLVDELGAETTQKEIELLTEMYGSIVSDVGRRTLDIEFFHPYLNITHIPEHVRTALYRWRLYKLQIAAAKAHLAELRAQLVNKIEEARLSGVDGKPHKDYKFLGTNKEEQAWSLQLLAPALYAEIALKEYSLDLLEVEAATTKTFLDLYVNF